MDLESKYIGNQLFVRKSYVKRRFGDQDEESEKRIRFETWSRD
jgi:hypothetical protein